MKAFRIFNLVLVLTLVVAFASSCYIGTGTTMKKAKGTYELTGYTITDALTNDVTDKIAENGIKSYLIVTGESKGYYVYKSDSTPAYYREVYLSYEYSENNTRLVTYLTFRFEGQSTDDAQRLGINSNSLNYSRPAIKLSELLHTDGLSYTWTKVSTAIDLSFAESQLGTIPAYAQP